MEKAVQVAFSYWDTTYMLKISCPLFKRAGRKKIENPALKKCGLSIEGCLLVRLPVSV